jgi:sulfonate dioxygenase
LKIEWNCIESNNMAPSATETTTIPVRSEVKLATNTGPYKELSPIGYEKEAEEKGKNGFSAAKVCQRLRCVFRAPLNNH